jgi:uncharacterized LabA/DUF88 family protein
VDGRRSAERSHHRWPVPPCHLHSTWGNGLNNRIALFIDGVNLYASARALGFDVDFKRLIERFRGHGELLRAFYYTTTDDHKYPSVRPLIDWLDYNGYTVVAKATGELSEARGRYNAKANIDIELVVNAMEIAGRIDHMVLFSGAGDFRRLVEAMQHRGVRVTVVSTASSRSAMVADELRRQADIFVDLVDLQSVIGRCS